MVTFKNLTLLNIGVLVAFAATTLWATTVTGCFESAIYREGHFEAGSGNWFLLVRMALGLMSTLILLVAMYSSCSWGTRLRFLLAAVAVVLASYWSTVGLEREGAGYSESLFAAIEADYQRGIPLTAAAVSERLGEPVLVFKPQSDQTAWCYTYMPTGGYGWHKRVVCLDHNQQVSRIYSLDEP